MFKIFRSKLSDTILQSEPETGEFIYLKDQVPLSQQEKKAALAAGQWADEILNSRSNRLDELNLDKEVGEPGANWEGDKAFYRFTRAITSGEVLDKLRLFSQQFTGYALHQMSREVGVSVPSLETSDRQFDQFFETVADKPDESILKYETICRHLPEYLHITPPRQYGEVGWLRDGKIINYDTAAYLERIALLYDIGLLDRENPDALYHRDQVTIIEIGSGYGGLAYFLKQQLPQARFIAVDLPESLVYSAEYLSAIYHSQQLNYGVTEQTLDNLAAYQPGCTFVPNYEFGLLVDSGITADLCINTLSMSEMNAAQVQEYCAGIKQMIGETGVFFEQNQDNEHLGFLNAQNVIEPFFSHVHRIAGPGREPVPPRLIESRGEHNIVLFKGEYFCIPWSAGAVNFMNPPLEQGYANVWANAPLPPTSGIRSQLKQFTSCATIDAARKAVDSVGTAPQSVAA